MPVNIEDIINSALSMTQSERKFEDIPKIWVHFLIHIKTKKIINTHNLFIKIDKFSLVTFNNLLKKVIKLIPLFSRNTFLPIHDIKDFVKDCSLSDSSKAILAVSRAPDTRTCLQEIVLCSWIFSIMPLNKWAHESFKPWCRWFGIFFNASALLVILGWCPARPVLPHGEKVPL